MGLLPLGLLALGLLAFVLWVCLGSLRIVVRVLPPELQNLLLLQDEAFRLHHAPVLLRKNDLVCPKWIHLYGHSVCL